MKEYFIWILQGILKYRKRLIYGLLALFIGQICFFNLGGIGIDNQVFADKITDTENASQKTSLDKLVTEKTSFVDFWRKAVYILIYPLMFLAGKLVDNSFVYGEVFYFDAVLWKLWNTVRNLANFGLGFLFLYYIFRYLIKQKNDDKGPKWIITRSLIAGVGIQASWFIMAVLIDLSTIMIYGIGGLPLSILGSGTTVSGTGDSKEYNPYAMKTIVSVDANDIADMNVYMTNILTGGSTVKHIYISECDTFQVNGTGERYILAPKMLYYQPETGTILPTEQKLCHYYGSIHRFADLVNGIEWKQCQNDCKTQQSEYNTSKTNVKGDLKKNLSKIETELKAGHLLIPGKIVDTHVGWDEDNLWIGSGSNGDNTIRLRDIMKQQETKTYVGAFTSLYSSLLEAGRGMVPVEDMGVYVKFLSILLSLGHVLAIGIPLAIAVLVLIMRIGIIWMAIILSPMIVLLSAFGFLDEYKDKDGVLSYLQIENLLGIIFSPVVICFAISMSTVLVRLIESIGFKGFVLNEFEILGLIKMDLSGFTADLSRLIVGVMGVAISWFLVWMAVKMSKLGRSGIVKDLEGLAKTSLGSMPIVPVPGKNKEGVEFIGANTAFGLNGQKGIIGSWDSHIKNTYEGEQNKTIQQLRDPESAAKEAEQTRESNKFDVYHTALLKLNANQVEPNWLEQDIEGTKFNSLNDAQKKEIIDKINGLKESDVDLLNAFGNGEVKTINIGGKVYRFQKNEGYIEDSSTQGNN